MVAEAGTVIQVAGDRALVRFERTSMCGSCCACGMAKGQQFADRWLNNEVHARAGDRVQVDLTPRGLLGAAGIVYVAPLIAFVASLFIFSFLGELGCFFAALGLTALVFLAIKLLDPVFAKRRAFVPRLVAVLPPETPSSPNEP
ncbi:MAG: SoxR reducing system RseC family protein [Christensenellales bacterium]|jgi:positive regulator of sigma E activity